MPLPFPFTTYGANRSSNIPSDPSCDFTYCYGGSWVQGKVGRYGLTFDKSNEDYVDITTGGDLGFTTSDDFTIACWVSSSTGESTGQAFVSKAAYPHNGYILGRVTTAEDPDTDAEYYDDSFTFTLRNAGSYVYLNTTASISDGWHHVAAVRRNSKSEIWLDGALNREAGSTTNLGDSGENALVGKWWTYSAYGFLNGKIDEVGIWDVALTSSQISALYNSGDGARADSITPPAASDGAWVSGKVDTYALDFAGNGSDDYVDLPAGAVSGSNSNATSGTMAAWIYPEANSNYEMMFSKGKPGSNHYIYWSMSPGVTNAPRLTHWNGFVQKTYTSTIGVPLHQWTHVAVSSDDTDIYFYVNGTASTGTTDTGASWFGDLDSDATKTIIGALWYSGSPQYEFDGKIDEFAIWTEPLDLGAIKELYADGVGAKANTVSSSVLVSYYDFEDGPTSTTLTDQTANGYNGTLENFSDTGTTGSLLMYYDFEIGDSNPVSGNFPGNSTVYDVVTASFHSPTAHTGTMTNMSVADFGSWGQGKIGKYCLDFDGGATPAPGDYDYVFIPSASALPIGADGGDFTFAAWCYQTSNLGWRPAIYRGDADDGWDNQIFLGKTAVGTMGFYVGDYGTPAEATFTELDTWEHFVGVYDSSTPLVSIYKNGVLIDSETPTNLNNPSIGDLYLGAMSGTTAQPVYPWEGSLDEISIWSGSLSQANITSLAAGEKANAITASSATGSWTTGKIGDYSIGLNQDGVSRTATSEGITAASASAFPLGATVSSAGDGPAFSVAAWIYPTVLAGSGDAGAIWRVIVGRDGAGTTGYNGWKMSMDGADGDDGMISWAPGGYASSGYNGRARSSTGAIEVNKWHLVVGVWEPSDTGNEVKMYIYKEGASSVLVQTSYSGLTFTPGPGDEKLAIGSLDYLEGGYLTFGWMGKIDDVGIWNVALDSGATDSLWNSGTGSAATTVSSSNLVSNWTMDSTYGTTTIVDGVAGNNGTLYNATMPAAAATLAAYYDMECDGPGSANLKDLSGNDLSGTLTNMSSGSCGSG